MSTARGKRVADAGRAIRELYAAGRKVPPKQSHRDAYNQGTLEAAGEQFGLSAEAALPYLTARDQQVFPPAGAS